MGFWMGHASRPDEDEGLAVAPSFLGVVVGFFLFVVVLVILRACNGPLGWKTLWQGWLYIHVVLEGVYIAVFI